ncbi:MAG: ammonium transporter [Spirochaetales bacterium]|nr:ammonium transporter [Spirochaetales bacterium]
METSLLDTLWILVSGSLVFLMQAGFALLESGLTRSKNSINVAIKNLTDLGVSLIAFWLFGFALMFGPTVNGLIGWKLFALRSGGNLWLAAFFFFQAMFCSTAATIVSGAVAERMRYSSYIVATILLSALVYPVFGHWAWGGFLTGETSGWLGSRGFIDFAGSTVVHSVGGWISLAALVIIGPRLGRFPKDGPARSIPGSNIPMAVVGVIILWFGWFGFNGGSTLAMNDRVPVIITNTALAAAAGMVGTLALGWPIFRRPDISLVLNGTLAGLVAITAPVAYVSELDSVVIGLIGGGVMLGSQFLLERLRIDDAVGAVPVHLFAGIWGTLAVALFGDPELLGTGLSFGQQLLIQSQGIVVAGVWAFGLAYIFLSIFNRISPLRVTVEHETDGLNVAEHGASTEIYDFFRVLEIQATQGDMRLRAPEEPFTEVGQIARRYNQVMDTLETNLIAKSEYLSILDNVSDGLLLINENLEIGPFFSKATNDVLRGRATAGGSLQEILRHILPEDSSSSATDYLGLLFDPKIENRTIKKLNPLRRREFFFDDGSGNFDVGYLEFSFIRITKEENIDRVMVLVRDVTSEVKLSTAVEKAQQETLNEMELFYRMIHVDPQLLGDFIEAAEEHIVRINGNLSRDTENLLQVLNEIGTEIHSLKGDSQLLELTFISSPAEAFEDEIQKLRKEPGLSQEYFVGLAVRLSDLQKQITITRGLMERLASFQQSFAAQNATGRDLLPISLEGLAARLGTQLGKRVRLDSDSFSPTEIPRHMRRQVRDILVQLTRNAVYHGIEDPKERENRGKIAEGLIRISSYLDEGRVVLVVRDDGRGIDARMVRARALRDGLISGKEKFAEQDLVRLLFTPGFSTAEDNESEVAGRGMGMSVVRSTLAKIGGKLRLSSRAGEFLEIVITLPAIEGEVVIV